MSRPRVGYADSDESSFAAACGTQMIVDVDANLLHWGEVKRACLSTPLMRQNLASLDCESSFPWPSTTSGCELRPAMPVMISTVRSSVSLTR